MDVLADILTNLRLRGQMYFRTEFVGRWGVALPADRHSIRFHLVLHGECRIRVDGDAHTRLIREGDFALVPHGAAQHLFDASGTDAVPLQSLLEAGALGADGVLRHGSGESGAQTRLLCGFCRFDEGLNHPLFAGLPALLAMGRSAAGNAPWIAEAVRVIAMEAALEAPGGSAIMNRLMEVLFIQAIRAQGSEQRGAGSQRGIPFVAALSDDRLKPAIEAMHRHPEREWTLSRLAALSSLSRGRFAQRFRDRLGRSPMNYLADWRLQKARRLLKESELSVAEVGLRCGYQSLPSFTRRFGKQFGISPAAFRRRP